MTTLDMQNNDRVSPEKRSFIMSRVKSKDTTPEIKLRRELWRLGVRYRVAVKRLPGKPDIVFTKAKVAIFVDGAFWHGKKLSPERLSRMSTYWREKIQRNVARDKQVTTQLHEIGYLVLRFDEKDILKNPGKIARNAISLIRDRTL